MVVLEPVLVIVPLVLVPAPVLVLPEPVPAVVEVAAGDAAQLMCIPERMLQLHYDGRRHPPDYFELEKTTWLSIKPEIIKDREEGFSLRAFCVSIFLMRTHDP